MRDTLVGGDGAAGMSAASGADRGDPEPVVVVFGGAGE